MTGSNVMTVIFVRTLQRYSDGNTKGTAVVKTLRLCR